MADINSVTIIGRATKDAELRTTSAGSSITNLSIANNSSNDRVSYFDVVLFDKTAEVAAKYAVKGKQLCISGKLQQRRWESKDGKTNYSVEIVGHTLQLLGGSEFSKQEYSDTHDFNKRQADNLPDENNIDKPIDLNEIPF